MTTDVGWPKETLGVSPGTDSVLGAWSRMLTARFPFVKRTVLEDSRFADQRDAIALVIRQEFGVEPHEAGCGQEATKVLWKVVACHRLLARSRPRPSR